MLKKLKFLPVVVLKDIRKLFEMIYKNLCESCSIAFKLVLRNTSSRKFCKNGLDNYNNNSMLTTVRHLSSHIDQESRYFITTPIFYVNAAPHIGHLQTVVLADAVQRWRALRGDKCLFATGTDEHGLKVQQAAATSNQTPSVFCDKVSKKYLDLFHKANIGHTDFIRTTELRHKEAVKKFWKTLLDGGYIYQGTYEGWYCTADEAFLTESQITNVTLEDGTIKKASVESGQPVEWMTEDNYMFRLTQFIPQLTDWINTGVIYPKKFESVVRAWLSEGFPDLSVSRQRQRLHWGISVPGDDTQTIYVWLDALVNYLTVSGYPNSSSDWPVDCHVIGKDILKFHAIYWPAFLMAAGLHLPRKIVCHSHWMVHNEKMSKSRGNVVDPFDRIERFSSDGLRYFLLKEAVPHSDGNYTDEKVLECINNDLVNTLGNLLQRCTSHSVNPGQVVPPLSKDTMTQQFSSDDIERYDNLINIIDKVDLHFNEFNIYKGLDLVMNELRWANGLLQHHKPWELAKDGSQTLYIQTLLHIAMETLMICGIVLQPIVPQTAEKLLTKLGVSPKNRTCTKAHEWLHKMRTSTDSIPLGQLNGVLFTRLNRNILPK